MAAASHPAPALSTSAQLRKADNTLQQANLKRTSEPVQVRPVCIAVLTRQQPAGSRLVRRQILLVAAAAASCSTPRSSWSRPREAAAAAWTHGRARRVKELLRKLARRFFESCIDNIGVADDDRVSNAGEGRGTNPDGTCDRCPRQCRNPCEPSYLSGCQRCLWIWLWLACCLAESKAVASGRRSGCSPVSLQFPRSLARVESPMTQERVAHPPVPAAQHPPTAACRPTCLAVLALLVPCR